jgi:hypothetical protein
MELKASHENKSAKKRVNLAVTPLGNVPYIFKKSRKFIESASQLLLS